MVNRIQHVQIDIRNTGVSKSAVSFKQGDMNSNFIHIILRDGMKITNLENYEILVTFEGVASISTVTSPEYFELEYSKGIKVRVPAIVTQEPTRKGRMEMTIFEGDYVLATSIVGYDVIESLMEIDTELHEDINVVIEMLNTLQDEIESFQLTGGDLLQQLNDRFEQDKVNWKGDPFEFEDFTPEQLEQIRGPKGDTPDLGSIDEFTWSNLMNWFTEMNILKGDNENE